MPDNVENPEVGQEPQTTEPQVSEPKAPEPQATEPQIDPQAIAEQVAQRLQQQQQPQLSPEQIREMLAVYEVTPEQLQTLGYDAESAKTAAQFYNQLVQGTAKHAVALAALQMAQLRQELLQQLEPLRQFYMEAQEQRLREEFFQKYPDMKPYEPVLEVAYERRLKGQRFNSKEEAFKALYAEAKELLSRLPGAGQPNKPSTVSTGGQTVPQSSQSSEDEQKRIIKLLFG